MIRFDVINLANSLVMEKDDSPPVREQIAIRMVEAAIEIINHPSREEKILDELGDIYDEHYGMLTPDLVIDHVKDSLLKQMDRFGWDKRLRVKVTFKKIANVLNYAMIGMDLDATLKANAKPAKAQAKKKPSLDVISDNPSQDVLNEFLNSVERRSARRTPLLSDRQPTTVKEPFRRDWDY